MHKKHDRCKGTIGSMKIRCNGDLYQDSQSSTTLNFAVQVTGESLFYDTSCFKQFWPKEILGHKIGANQETVP